MSESIPDKLPRFTFDNDFFELANVPGGPPKQAAAPGAEKKPPKNIKEALEQGYAEGFAAAQAQSEASYQTEVDELKTAANAILQTLQTAVTEASQSLTSSGLTLLRASLHHLVGHAAENYPEQILETHLKDIVTHLSSHEELTLRIAPSARGYHEKLGLTHANIQGVGFHIKEDSGLRNTDCVAEWRRGGIEAKLQDHLEKLEALLTNAGAAGGPVPVLEKTKAPETEPQPSQDKTEAPPPPPEEPIKPTSLADELRADDDMVDALK
ncbi:MAG: hypothetical protein COY40_06060 [Alphaproteobacteria bacterium CG_4_10_14_0_8_um_filter_53_9]|nr:MAG: hypothetical protein COY40_06060 [Alphaproteobacteria bacterium CG_4_10_14_0_8_um_filter_53_9]